jgi:methylase of polypeptide subunit release factors
MEITPSEWAKMHARIYDIEIWKARKEVVDETRHEQNQLELKRANSRIDETHTVSMENGEKLDTLLLRTAGQDAQEKVWNRIKLAFWGFIVTMLGGSAGEAIIKKLQGH